MEDGKKSIEVTVKTLTCHLKEKGKKDVCDLYFAAKEKKSTKTSRASKTKKHFTTSLHAFITPHFPDSLLYIIRTSRMK